MTDDSRKFPFRRGRPWWLLLFLFATVSFAESERTAERHFRHQEYQEAWEIYRRLTAENPGDHRLAYNAGVAAYRNQTAEEAVEHFRTAARATDLQLQQRAHYNLGNALYRKGEAAAEPNSKAEDWKQAIQHYRYTLNLDDTDSQARDNLAFVERRLEELQEQQQQQDQDQNQDQDQESSESEDDPNQESGESQDPQEQEQNQEPGESEDQQNQEASEAPNPQEPETPPADQEQDQEPGESEAESEPEESGIEGERSTPQQSGDPDEPPPQALGKMTPQQALQLLDSEKSQAKPLIFKPRQTSDRTYRSVKNW